MKSLSFKLLLSLMLILSFLTIGSSQTLESNETTNVVIPEQVMEQVVRRVLVWSFKPRNKPTVIYLAEERLNKSWLPTIKNIEFRLLSSDEILEKNLKVHFFTELNFSGKTYNIGFVFGHPICGYDGGQWHFRPSKQKIRLWQNGGVGALGGGDCNS
jgi:hypothetical protein